MKVGLYSANLAVAGGGEKYFLTIVEEAVKQWGRGTVVMAPTRPNPDEWRRLGISLTQDSFTWQHTPDRMLMTATRGLDLFVSMRWVPPVSFAERSVAIVQFPARPPEHFVGTPTNARDMGRRVKAGFERRALLSYDLVVCYSDFVREHAARMFGHPAIAVIYPPVDDAAPLREKKPLILSVGRFTEGKRQDALIEAFRRLCDGLGQRGSWELHIAGGLADKRLATAYLSRLRQLANGYPVIFHPNVPLPVLRQLYSEASVFWHAAGLGSEHLPGGQEHFGITTVEAMAHGCVPIVIALGGQPEIVTDGVDGLLWRSVDELVTRTYEVIASPDWCEALAGAAVTSAARFATARFRRNVRELIFTPRMTHRDR